MLRRLAPGMRNIRTGLVVYAAAEFFSKPQIKLDARLSDYARQERDDVDRISSGRFKKKAVKLYRH